MRDVPDRVIFIEPFQQPQPVGAVVKQEQATIDLTDEANRKVGKIAAAPARKKRGRGSETRPIDLDSESSGDSDCAETELKVRMSGFR